MALRRSHAIRRFVGLVLALCVVVGCSGSEQAQSDGVSPQETPGAAAGDSNVGTETSDTTNGSTVVPTSAPELGDEDIASVTDLASGEQVEDAQGNLIAVYGIAEWPESFADLSDDVQALFPFFGAVEGVGDPTSQLMALDVGMCSAGIDAVGSGTAEFFVHALASDVVSTDPVLDRGVLAQYPVVQPAFAFPAAAECARGWLPVLSSHDDTPAVARYVLATRPSSGAEVERHVYQWDLAAVSTDAPSEPSTVAIADVPSSDGPSSDGIDAFDTGQTATFNEGPLSGTSIDVDGWAEYVGQASALEGTRMVGVSLSFCPASDELPEFGLAVDGWNLVAPLESGLFGARDVDDPSEQCFDGWLDFAVPFGGVPTAFFASDGANASSGYAEWSLDDAALTTPE